MSRPPSQPAPEELLRQLALEALPHAAEDASPERRERLVRSVKASVERSFERAERARRVRRTLVGLAAAAAFLLLGAALLRERLPASERIAELTGVSGTVVLTHDGASQVVQTGVPALRDGDGLQTAAGAGARVLTPKSSVKLGESTELRLSRPSSAEERISLRRGRVDVAVSKAVETNRAVVVETPDAEVVVRGTVFDVRVEPRRPHGTVTHVHVTRGSVWVLAQGVQVALLSAGQRWSSVSGVEAAPPAASKPPAAAPSAGAVASSEPSAGRGVAARAPGQGLSSPKPGTLTEENRLFSAAVDARNRGDAARAAELFGELLSSYPRTALRESAQVERFRALSRAGQVERAAAEARRYLAEHADGFARDEARALALEAPARK